MSHKYIIEEGIWNAKGVFMDADEKVIPCIGIIEITHGDEVWLLDSRLTLFPETGEKMVVRKKHIIDPWPEGRKATNWTSVDHELGDLHGRYVLVEDSIVSNYETASKEYSGMEFISKIDDDTYTARSALLHNGKRVSFRALELKRK